MAADHAQAAAAYRAATLENAPPLRIIVLLYEGAIKALERARRLDPAQDRVAYIDSLSKADRIVCELRFSLDHGPAPQVSKQLEALYLFCEAEIGKAMELRNAQPVAGCIEVLSRLASGWRSIDAAAIGSVA